MKQRPHRRPRGFTLIELMIVVAIIGILAAIAIPNYYKQTLRARQTEASILLGAIKNGEVEYHATYGCFANVQRNPAVGPLPTPQVFDPAPTAGFTELNACDGGAKMFGDFHVVPTGGRVYFVYECRTGVVMSAAEFSCNAVGDLDGDGNLSELVFCSDINGDGVGSASSLGTACDFPWEPVRLSVDQF